ncbi:hypothetical protein [Streptomyces sp. NPDC051636]|uniref:hypothetical protein n=1 Tax=Streptomyces sp. NPDC051636 TaxID=3365663 RepID=UPI0037A3325F
MSTALSRARSDLVAKESSAGGWDKYVVRGAAANPGAVTLKPAAEGEPLNSRPVATPTFSSPASLTPVSTTSAEGPSGEPLTTVRTAEGVGYPKKLTAGVTYNFWVHAENGAKSASPYGLAGQKLSNDCNDAGMDPGSSCMGLNYTRAGSATELMVNSRPGWTVPSCAEWVRGGSPTASSNGTGTCPANS